MSKRGRWKRRLVVGLLGFVVLIVLMAWLYWLFPMWGMPFNASRNGPVPLTPAWALECWLWEDDANTADAVQALVKGYEQYDIPVRTILIDSPWSTHYNDFRVDEARYPNPEAFFGDLQRRGYRVVLWMTSMVDSRDKDTALAESSDWYESARTKGYLTGDGYQIHWWKGVGGFIDYTNPEAMSWWRGLQQDVFNWGIDGWKLDDAATLSRSSIAGIPLFYQRTHAGSMTTRGYMDHFYRDEYQHGLTQNPDFITLGRAMDRYWHPEGFAPRDAAPVTWVGDQDHAWALKDEGIEEALSDILRSAHHGYCVIGSDVAGFSGGTIPPHLYIRWAQFSTFCGLFLNGGHGERALWKRSEEELRVIRSFAWLHTELVPYMYSYVVTCHEGGSPLVRPVKGDYQYLFGDSLFVAPIHKDSLTRTVTLPSGGWRYLFDDGTLIQGPQTMTRDFPLDQFPVYVRDGAIIPMNVMRPYTGFGDRTSEGFLTLLIYPHGQSRFTVHHPDRSGETTIEVNEHGNIEIALTGVHKPHILRVFAERKPTEVRLDSARLAEGTDWQYDSAGKRLIVKTHDYQEGRYGIAWFE